jgi:hypothetical protein
MCDKSCDWFAKLLLKGFSDKKNNFDQYKLYDKWFTF